MSSKKIKIIVICIIIGIFLWGVLLPYMRLYSITSYITGDYMWNLVVNSAEKGFNYHFEEMRYDSEIASADVTVICYFTVNGRDYYLLADGEHVEMIKKPRESKKISEISFFQNEDGTVRNEKFEDVRMGDFWNNCKVYSKGASKLNVAYEKMWDELLDNYELLRKTIHEMNEKQRKKYELFQELN